MNIIEALKNKDHNLRISNGEKWLVWDDIDEQWTVYQRQYGKKKTHVVIKTTSEENAITALVA